jgi:NAD(P)-dependent dehydrogenase (short-subunit alcohol dehydrogenase family)
MMWVIVTAGAPGIGRAVAETFLSEGDQAATIEDMEFEGWRL